MSTCLSTLNSIIGNSIPNFVDKKEEYYYKKNLAKLVLANIEHKM